MSFAIVFSIGVIGCAISFFLQGIADAIQELTNEIKKLRTDDNKEGEK